MRPPTSIFLEEVVQRLLQRTVGGKEPALVVSLSKRLQEIHHFRHTTQVQPYPGDAAKLHLGQILVEFINLSACLTDIRADRVGHVGRIALECALLLDEAALKVGKLALEPLERLERVVHLCDLSGNAAL